MNKINFVNGKSPALNAANLNQMQNNIENAISTQTVTTANTNLNDYTTAGVYYFNTNVTPTNIPSGTNGWLEVIHSGYEAVKQIWYRSGVANQDDFQTYVRTYINGWSSWKQYQMVEDSGWKTATLSSSFKAYNDTASNTPQYRKVGKTVEIRGLVSPKTEISGGATEYTIFTLPSGFRPSKQITKICQGSTRNVWLITINTDGVVEFSRHRDETGYTNATTTAWLLFSETFLVD